MTYYFSSDSQLIFKVMTFDGRQVAIHFSERDANNKSAFLTRDEKIARAIMAHSFFRKGRIVLVSTEGTATEDNDRVRFAPKPEPVPKPEPASEPTDTVAEQETEVPVTSETEDDQIQDDSNLTFPNITIAKDYLHRTYGVKKEDIRSLTKIVEFGRSKGLEISISAE